MSLEDQPSVPEINQLIRPLKDKDAIVDQSIDKYLAHFEKKPENDSTKKEESAMVTDNFYNLATDFYEYGWGRSFHFFAMNKGESFDHSISKHQFRLALKLGLQPGMKCLDVGCGVGGPGRNIAALSGAHVIGLNCNKYQISRCEFHTKNAGLEHLCKFVQGDFHNMEFSDNTFDAAFSIEATCHADDLSRVYGEVYRVLKPGSRYVSYEWIMTDTFDPNNTHHAKIKEDILVGNSLPDLATASGVQAALKKVGFKIIEAEDVANSGSLPWYTSLQGQMSLSGFKSTPLGMFMTHCMLWVMESLRISPQGSVKVHNVLVKGAKALLKAGEEGIFTPSYLVVVEKPAQ